MPYQISTKLDSTFSNVFELMRILGMDLFPLAQEWLIQENHAIAR